MTPDPYICPYCGSEDTELEDDLLYELSLMIRLCNGCAKYYEVHYYPLAVKEIRKLLPTRR